MTRALRRLVCLPARLALAAAFGDPSAWLLIIAVAGAVFFVSWKRGK